jgi:FkbM family methyltransferase
MSFSKSAITTIRLVRKVWPLPFGKNAINHFGVLATKIGLLQPVWHEFRPGLWMNLTLRDMIQETILLEDLWDPGCTKFICERLGAGEVFIDVGANAGYFTLLAAQKVGPRGKVLSVEADPSMASELRRNVEKNRFSNVIVGETACADHIGTVALYFSNTSNSGRASLSQVNAGTADSVSVPCTPLDVLVEQHHLERVDLVKIDVEGAELKVLYGMESTIRKFKPALILELEPSLLEAFSTTMRDVSGFLQRFGYRMVSLSGHSNYVCEVRNSR